MNRVLRYSILMCLFSHLLKASSETSLGAVITEVKVKTLLGDDGFKLKSIRDLNADDILSDLIFYWKGKSIIVEKIHFPEIISPEIADVRIRGEMGNNRVLHLVIPYNHTDIPEDVIPNIEKYCDALRLTFNDGKLMRCETCVASNKERTSWVVSVYDKEKGISLKSNTDDDSKVNPFLKGD